MGGKAEAHEVGGDVGFRTCMEVYDIVIFFC